MADESDSTADENATENEPEGLDSERKQTPANLSGLGLGILVFTGIIFFRTWAQVNGQIDMRVPLEAIVVSYAEGIFYLLALVMIGTSFHLLIRYFPKNK